MKLTNRTILITGGTSGIGMELARRLLERGNRVVITGRDQTKLDKARQAMPGVETIQSDASDPAAIEALHREMSTRFPGLDVLVNNAGIMRKLDVRDASRSLVDVSREIEINLSGPVRMVQQFLPLLLARPEAAIVNVSSGLAFVPLAIAPVYSATKAAMHSYSQSLRLQLGKTKVAVIELAPPGTETPLFNGDFTKEDLGGVKGMDVKVLVEHAIAGIEKGRTEIRPGVSNVLKWASRVVPNFMAKQLGKTADRMGARTAQAT